MLQNWAKQANNTSFTMYVSPEAFNVLLDAYAEQENLSETEIKSISRRGVPSGLFMVFKDPSLFGVDARVSPERTVPMAHVYSAPERRLASVSPTSAPS